MHGKVHYAARTCTSRDRLSSRFCSDAVGARRDHHSSYPLLDVYDGNVWRSFSTLLNVPSTDTSTLTLAWALNWDGFQPFTTSNKSCDAIYLVCLNLPRELRYLRQNMIVVGIRPWGSHGQNVHSLFVPLVDELLLLYQHGIHVSTYTPKEDPRRTRHVKCLLLLVACDLPAAKQLGGFSAHNAVQGCHRCTNTFRKPPEIEEEEEEEEKEDEDEVKDKDEDEEEDEDKDEEEDEEEEDEQEQEEEEGEEEEEQESSGSDDGEVDVQPVRSLFKGAAPRVVAAPASARQGASISRGTYFGDQHGWNVDTWKNRYVQS
jgi:hypothetical protein